MSSEKSNILIFGGCGYLGNFMVKASVSLGHPTFVYTRPLNPHPPKAPPTSKFLLLKDFESIGVTIFYVFFLFPFLFKKKIRNNQHLSSN